MLRIGEFARLANVSIKLLRHYDLIGLLPAHAVDRSTGYRYYSVMQLTRLNRLLVYRNLGFSLREIRKLIESETSPDALRGLLTEKHAAVAARVEAERAQLADLAARIAQIDAEGQQRPYEIVIRSVDAAAAVSLRKDCDSYDEVGELLHSLRSKLPSRAVAGHGAIWHQCQGTANRIECEALVLLDSRRASFPRGLNVVSVPACTVASVLYEECMANPGPAYRAAIERARDLGYEVAGPMREYYFSYAATAGALVEAQFPLVRARS